MSGGDDWSRRAVLGGSAAFLALVHQRGSAFETPDLPILMTRIATVDGIYHGYRLRDSATTSYHGIRYARAARFAAPVATPAAEQFRDGQSFGPACPQSGDRYAPVSEDCLFLNIWTDAPGDGDFPTAAQRRRRCPVMVYFHGGAYSTGSVTDPLNDGGALAARGDVVVVTVNHRLNAFGYLYMPDRFPDSGNAGQLDLICALQWVRRNIAAFGGDPANVTVFGQSGGGAKIATLMAMPAAAGLFHKAITMSGQQVTVSGPLNAARRARAFLDQLGPDVDPATAPVEQVIAALAAVDPILGGTVYMGPVLDMRSLHRHPFWPDAAPQSLGIPMMLGNTVSETRAFYPADGRVLGELTMDNLALRIAPEMRIDIEPHWVVAQFRARYPGLTALQLFHRIVTAARSWRGQVIEAEERARADVPAFVYQLDFEDAKHTDDIGLAFGTVTEWTPARRAMSDRVMDAFVRFARTGDPGWAPYSLPERATMIFDTRSLAVANPRAWERELFAAVPYIQPGT